MKLARTLPMLLVISATCVDYELVGPAAPGEAELHVFLDVKHAETLTLTLYGFFRSGAGASGAVRALADSTMLLQDQITPPDIVEPSQLRYTWQAQFVDALVAPDSARARGPIIEADAPPPTLWLPVMRRLQPLRLEHPVGSDLILELSSVPVPQTLSRMFGQWFLDIERDNAQILTLRSDGSSPSRLRLEWAWLEQSVVPGDSLSATLLLSDTYEVTASPYRTNVSRQAQLFWTIILVSPP